MGVLTSKIDGIGMELFNLKKFLVIAMIGLLLWTGSAVSDQVGGEKKSTLTAEKNSSFSETILDDNEEFNPGKEFRKMMLSVLLIIVLGIGVLYLSKKVLPKMSNSPGKNIHVVETAHLGPRRWVHLVEIGDRQILIGSTNENITKLADISIENSNNGQEL